MKSQRSGVRSVARVDAWLGLVMIVSDVEKRSSLETLHRVKMADVLAPELYINAGRQPAAFEALSVVPAPGALTNEVVMITEELRAAGKPGYHVPYVLPLNDEWSWAIVQRPSCLNPDTQALVAQEYKRVLPDGNATGIAEQFNALRAAEKPLAVTADQLLDIYAGGYWSADMVACIVKPLVYLLQKGEMVSDLTNVTIKGNGEVVITESERTNFAPGFQKLQLIARELLAQTMEQGYGPPVTSREADSVLTDSNNLFVSNVATKKQLLAFLLKSEWLTSSPEIMPFPDSPQDVHHDGPPACAVPSGVIDDPKSMELFEALFKTSSGIKFPSDHAQAVSAGTIIVVDPSELTINSTLPIDTAEAVAGTKNVVDVVTPLKLVGSVELSDRIIFHGPNSDAVKNMCVLSADMARKGLEPWPVRFYVESGHGYRLPIPKRLSSFNEDVETRITALYKTVYPKGTETDVRNQFACIQMAAAERGGTLAAETFSVDELIDLYAGHEHWDSSASYSVAVQLWRAFRRGYTVESLHDVHVNLAGSMSMAKTIPCSKKTQAVDLRKMAIMCAMVLAQQTDEDPIDPSDECSAYALMQSMLKAAVDPKSIDFGKMDRDHIDGPFDTFYFPLKPYAQVVAEL